MINMTSRIKTAQPRSFRVPLDTAEEARLYWEIGRRGAFCTGGKNGWRYGNLPLQDLVVLALLQCRYDPRLLALMIDWLPRTSHCLDAVSIKEALRKNDFLPAVAVISEFVLENNRSLPPVVTDFFQFLKTGVKPAPTQLFYRGLYPVGSRKMDDAISQPLWFFKKWGFLAADPPVLKEIRPRRLYLYDRRGRLEMLRHLSQEKKRFRLKDYLKEIGSSISRQQALKDLQSVPWIRKMGRGKGTIYSLTRSKFQTP